MTELSRAAEVVADIPRATVGLGTEILEVQVADQTDAVIFDVRLEGGPADLPEALRTARVTELEETVKVKHHGGYEHFQHPDPNGDNRRHGEVTVFRWTARTKIAE